MSKEAIIAKIISDAQLKAKSTIKEANIKAASILANSTEQSSILQDESLKEIDFLVADIARRGKTVAELDSKKIMLAAKVSLLDTAFDMALVKVKNLDKKAYIKLIKGMLENAEDGDTVIISEIEKAIVTKKLIDDIAKDRGISLSLAKDFGDFKGGIVLENNGIAKNLTFEVEINMLRDAIEADIAKELFS